METKILYEDTDIVAINKPSGLMVHGDGRSEEKTLIDWIKERYPDIEEVGEDQVVQGKVLKRPGIVHRLDRETSGVLVIAKTKKAFEFLKKQFQDRKVEKVYRAFVYGNFGSENLNGIIDEPIGRSKSDFRQWSAEFGAKGELREAATHYKVLKQNSNFAYLEIKPKTGRTHQIRVHLKAIGHQVICDRLYAPKRELALGFDRLALHALSISLELPSSSTHSGSGSFIKIESELPADFLEAEKLL